MENKSPKSSAAITVQKFMKNNMRIELTPLGSAPSLPIPMIMGKKAYLSFLFFLGKRLSKEEKMKIYRPRSRFVVQYGSGKIVKYEDYAFQDEFPEQDWKNPIGEFPHEKIRKLTLKSYQKKRERLIDLYDEVIRSMLSSQYSNIRKEFIETFDLLCEPALLPFMKKIGEEFFQWMEE